MSVVGLSKFAYFNQKLYKVSLKSLVAERYYNLFVNSSLVFLILIEISCIKACTNIEDQGSLRGIKGANMGDQGSPPVGTLDLFWVPQLN